MDWAAIISAVVAASAVAYTAWNARRTKGDELEVKRAENTRPDWQGFTRSLEQRVASQDKKIDELFRQVGQIRSDLDAEQRRSGRLLAYLRRVLLWALELSPEHRPPAPPHDLADDLADLWRYQP